MIADSQFPTRLTPNSVIIYGYLSRRPNKVIPYEELQKVLYVSNKHSIKSRVAEINKKLKTQIRNVRGVGYVFVDRETL